MIAPPLIPNRAKVSREHQFKAIKHQELLAHNTLLSLKNALIGLEPAQQSARQVFHCDERVPQSHVLAFNNS